MEFDAAQRDLARAYANGAPGVLTSGVIWAIAGLVSMRLGSAPALLALFVGGMAIVPSALLISRGLLKAPKATPRNPLDRLGLESAFVLFAGLFLAFCLLFLAPKAALSALAIVVGARYFLFRTLYGESLYWVLGALVAAAGGVSTAVPHVVPVNVGLVVGGLEVAFGALLLMRRKH